MVEKDIKTLLENEKLSKKLTKILASDIQVIFIYENISGDTTNISLSIVDRHILQNISNIGVLYFSEPNILIEAEKEFKINNKVYNISINIYLQAYVRHMLKDLNSASNLIEKTIIEYFNNKE